MFIILPKFSDNKATASALMDAHNAWIKQCLRRVVFNGGYMSD